MLCIRAYVPPYLLFVQPVGVGQRQQVKPQSQHRVTALEDPTSRDSYSINCGKQKT